MLANHLCLSAAALREEMVSVSNMEQEKMCREEGEAEWSGGGGSSK